MQNIIQFKIYKGEELYVGEGIDIPVVTQGKTLDDVVANIREALSLYVEDNDLQDVNVAANPSVLINYELEAVHAA